MRFLQQARDYVAGQPIENPDSAIIMFNTCAAMEWNHLPVAGGVYDQDPVLLARWRVIWKLKHEHDRAEEKRRDLAAKRKK